MNIVAINIIPSGIFGSSGFSELLPIIIRNLPPRLNTKAAIFERKNSKSDWIKEPGFGVSTVVPPVPPNVRLAKLKEFPVISSTVAKVADAPATSSTDGR